MNPTARRASTIRSWLLLLPSVPMAATGQQGPGTAAHVDGGAARVGAQATSADPLTSSWSLLLTLRDHPELATDEALTTFTLQQVAAEQGAWRLVDPGPSRFEIPPAVTYVWQEAIETDPEFASGPLLDVFLRQGADWSFARHDPRWVERTDTRAEAFIFSRDAIEGRQPEFAARELVPVLKRHLDVAIASTPTRFYVTAELPRFAYDFDAGAIRFLEDGTSLTEQGYTFSESVVPLTPLPSAYYDLSGMPEGRVYYTNFYRLEDRSSTQPGGHETSPTTAWRSVFPIGGSGATFPNGLILALDRAPALSSLLLDPARAERLVTMNAVDGMGGSGLRARIHFEVERVDLIRRTDQPHVARTLVARLERIEVLGENDEVVAEIP